MKKHYLFALLALLITVISSACAPAPVVYQGAVQGTASSGGIIVSQQNLGLFVDGNGKAIATPDVVILILGVESQQKTVAQAQKETSDAMDKVIQVLKNNGIAVKDIQTREYNIQQITQWDDKQNLNIVIGYRVSNMVEVKLRDISKAGNVIDNVSTAGGDLTRIDGINFSVDDPAPLYKIAREKAIKAAMDKAGQMAQVSGVKLGKVLSMSESTYNVPVVRNTYLLKSVVNEGAASAPTSISGGELEFQATVQIVYEIK